MLHGGRRGKTRRLDNVALVVVRLLIASWSQHHPSSHHGEWRREEGGEKEKERYVHFLGLLDGYQQHEYLRR